MPRKFRTDEEWHAFLVGQMESDGRMYHKLAYGVLRDAAAAEDACQQALLRAMECPVSLLWSVRSQRAWLAKVVVNEALRLRRRRDTELRVLPRRPPASDAAPRADDWMLRDEVVAAIDQLPEETRTVVVLRILDGLSGAEVKDILDCSHSHVSRELHAGMKLLRQTLRDWEQR